VEERVEARDNLENETKKQEPDKEQTSKILDYSVHMLSLVIFQRSTENPVVPPNDAWRHMQTG
jgi:hypothetical protein